MTEEPTPPEADEIDEDADDEPEVEGFMQIDKLGGIGSIMRPIKVPPSGPAGPGPNPGPTTTPTPGTGTPGPVTFPGPA